MLRSALSTCSWHIYPRSSSHMSARAEGGRQTDRHIQSWERARGYCPRLWQQGRVPSPHRRTLNGEWGGGASMKTRCPQPLIHQVSSTCRALGKAKGCPILRAPKAWAVPYYLIIERAISSYTLGISKEQIVSVWVCNPIATLKCATWGIGGPT